MIRLFDRPNYFVPCICEYKLAEPVLLPEQLTRYAVKVYETLNSFDSGRPYTINHYRADDLWCELLNIDLTYLGILSGLIALAAVLVRIFAALGLLGSTRGVRQAHSRTRFACMKTYILPTCMAARRGP